MSDTNSRVQSLDILRAIAVILVLGRHMPGCPEDTPLLLRNGMGLWARSGWIGVDLFFVLSGFLVSGLLFREFNRHGNVRIGRFLARRGLKIYPAFYVMLSTTLAIVLWRNGGISLSRYVSECLFLQSYFPGVWNHTWTLAIEEHFYLLLALVVAFLVTRGKRSGSPFASLPWLFYCVAAAVLLLRCMTSFSSTYSHTTHLFPTHLRIDSLFFGVFLSYLYCFHLDRIEPFTRQFRFHIIAISLLLLSPVLFLPLGSTPWLPAFGLTLLYLGFGGIVISTVDWRPNCPRPFRIVGGLLAAIGFYSYSIYLWHMPVNVWGSGAIRIATGVQIGYWSNLFVYMIGSLIVGVLMAKLIEMPVLRIRDRYFPSRSQKQVASTKMQVEQKELSGVTASPAIEAETQ
ncbi:acyltransferase family protein [Gimesia aquarii]|uniref:O-acetyltransferase OatA n=1 Tax=Gimesia aquarii TaxID=2527964 RepID=A0A517WWM2_9PLAN|nr:acyltransferase [Gimesia aquarii]QDU09665.1 O-acetyltransferase OatA [Gimesia aquarii]